MRVWWKRHIRKDSKKNLSLIRRKKKDKMKNLVLIIDDEVAKDLANLLGGCKIAIAKNKEEALRKVFLKKPKVISLDNYMPINKYNKIIAPCGNTIARVIKEYLPEARVLGVSSASNQFNLDYFDKIINKRNLNTKEYKETILNYLNEKK